MNAVTQTVAAEPVSGVEIFVPLAKLKKSPRNARKVPHGEAAIEALAASIQHKGLIQNLVVEPEVKEDGTPTGCYFVTAGEGRRLAMLLRAKRKQIKKSEPVRCWLDTANDPAEISLDENVTRTPMHPADQFERFAELSNDKGWGAQEIGARFGVSAHVVKQRLRLGAVSPKLLQVYREDGLTLDQLMAFAISEDHARQEQVFESLHHNREPWIIRRDMTAANVPAGDRRAVFVGADAFVEAGGNIIRDLFSEDRGGFFEDAGLLDMLAIEKLREIAGEVQAEGWKWAEAHIDYPHAHGMRRFYPQTVALSDEDEARLEALSAEHDELAEGYSSYDEMPEDVAEKLEAMSDEIDAISAKRYAYDANVIAHGGVFVVLNHDGVPRLERGFVRAEDEALADPQPEPEAEGDATAPEAVEEERREQFREEGAHFESAYYLTLLWMPPAEEAARAEGWLYEGRSTSGVDPWELLKGFTDRSDRVLNLVEGFVPEVRWLDDGETLTYLHSTISTRRQRVRVPETPMHLDALLADEPLTGGLEPRLGDHHLRTLTVTGFPSVTFPGLLDELNRLAFEYRWSTRALMLDKTDATKLLTRIRRQWFAKRKSVAAILKEVMTNEASTLLDSDASNKAADADTALQELGADYAGMRAARLKLPASAAAIR